MTCQAPALALGPDHQSDLTERPEEFGFILDNVQSLLILNKTNFTYYPNPVFEAFSPSGILELKPGTPIILKVFQISFSWHFSYRLLMVYWEDERVLVYVMY
jgi:plexin A